MGDPRILHLERRALAYRRLDPDTTAMHLHNLFGDGETQTGAALGLGVRAIDLMKLVKDARLMFRGDAAARQLSRGHHCLCARGMRVDPRVLCYGWRH